MTRIGTARLAALAVVLVLTAAAAAGLASARPAEVSPSGPGATAAASEDTCNWVGQVMLVGFFWPASGTVQASGQSLPTSAYPDLYQVIGHRFGGSGSTFRVPNLIARAPDGLRYIICTQGAYPVPQGSALGNTCNALGQVVLVAFNGGTANTVTANGQLLSTRAYPNLFKLIGNQFGGHVSKGTFGTPNLTRRTPSGLRYLLCTRGTYPRPSRYIGQWCNWIGQIPLYAFNPLQSGRQMLNGEFPASGELLSVNQWAALYSLLGPQFSQNPFSYMTFNLPDLRRSTPSHMRYQVCAYGYYPTRAY